MQALTSIMLLIRMVTMYLEFLVIFQTFFAASLTEMAGPNINDLPYPDQPSSGYHLTILDWLATTAGWPVQAALIFHVLSHLLDLTMCSSATTPDIKKERDGL